MEQKPFYASKTMWVFGLTLAGSILTYVIGPEFPVKLTTETVAAITATLSIGGIVLRAISKGEVYFKKPEGGE